MIFKEQIMSKDKYASIFSKSNGSLCLLSLKYFLKHAQFQKLGNIPRYSTVFAGEYSVT